MILDIEGKDLESIARCKCCGDIFGAPLFTLSAPSTSLAQFGFGLALYFSLTIYLIIVAGILLVF